MIQPDSNLRSASIHRMRRRPGPLMALLAAGSVVLSGCSTAPPHPGSPPPLDSSPAPGRYADYPLTLRCQVDYEPGSRDAEVPSNLIIRRASVEHLGGDRIAVNLTFPADVPQSSSSLQTGSLVYGILLRVSPGSGYITMSGTDGEWQSHDINLRSWAGLDTTDYDSPLLVAENVQRNQLRLELDLGPQQEFLKSERFEPIITLDAGFRSGQNDDPLGAAGLIPADTQNCSADTGRLISPTSSRLPATSRPAPSPPSRGTSPMKWVFRSATGNIACTLTEERDGASAACELRTNAYPDYPGVSGCRPDRPLRFTMVQGARATYIACLNASEYSSGIPVQGYGRPISVGAITCTLNERTGVRCEDKSTGSFFQASREQAKWG